MLAVELATEQSKGRVTRTQAAVNHVIMPRREDVDLFTSLCILFAN